MINKNNLVYYIIFQYHYHLDQFISKHTHFILHNPSSSVTHPLNLQTRFRPPVHRQVRVQVDKTRVRTTPSLPNPNPMLSTGPTCPKRTTRHSLPTRSHAVSLVSVHVAQARGRTIQRRLKQGFGTVKVQDCVTARDVKRQRTVELDSFVDNVRGHARVVGR